MSALLEMSMQHIGVGSIDGDVVNGFGGRKNRFSSGRKVVNAAALHLGPAQPTVVKPPVVMMCDQRNTLMFACCGKCVRQQEIARNPEIMRPDDAVSRGRTIEQSVDRACDARTKLSRGTSLLGYIPECGLDEKLDLGGCGPVDECVIPTGVQCFSARDNNGVHPGRAAQMRRCKLNDAADAAGSQVIMNDDEFQSLVIS